jgi:hypothetical protein
MFKMSNSVYRWLKKERGKNPKRKQEHEHKEKREKGPEIEKPNKGEETEIRKN